MKKINLNKNNKREDLYIYIYKLFPDCVTEIKQNDGTITHSIDFDKLKEFLSPVIADDKKEKYEFSWPDKRISKHSVNESTTNTLRPIKEKSIDFDNTKNLYIEGDNLKVLKVLRNTYSNEVDVIYIDPPYNTGKDFTYKDNFTKSNAQADLESGNLDEEGNRMVANKLENGRYHTDWLNMIYPRLLLAKDLLSDSGVIFISIDDHEYANLKKICDEIFGEENFESSFTWVKKHGPGGNTLGNVKIVNNTEQILCYSKNTKSDIFKLITHGEKELKKLGYINKDEFFEERGFYKLTPLYRPSSSGSFQYQESLDYKVEAPDGTLFGLHCNKNGEKNGCYTWGYETYLKGKELGFIEVKKNNDGDWVAYRKQYQLCKFDPTKKQIIKEPAGNTVENLIDKYYSSEGGREISELFGSKNYFDFPKPSRLISFLLTFIKKENPLILDFFSGSATTAHSVMQLNKEDGGKRKWIMIQLPEKVGNDSTAFSNNFHTICDIGAERIKKAGEIIKKENTNVDTGFRYLKIDTSNIKENTTPADKQIQMNLDHLIESIKSDRSELDLVFEIMLTKKIKLDTPIQEQIILDKKIYKVNDNFLICCFDDNLSEDFIKEVAKLSPFYLVFKESSFANDQAIKNSEELIRAFSKRKTECEII